MRCRRLASSCGRPPKLVLLPAAMPLVQPDAFRDGTLPTPCSPTMPCWSELPRQAVSVDAVCGALFGIYLALRLGTPLWARTCVARLQALSRVPLRQGCPPCAPRLSTCRSLCCAHGCSKPSSTGKTAIRSSGSRLGLGSCASWRATSTKCSHIYYDVEAYVRGE